MLWCKSNYKDEEIENESSSDYDHISVKSSWGGIILPPVSVDGSYNLFRPEEHILNVIFFL